VAAAKFLEQNIEPLCSRETNTTGAHVFPNLEILVGPAACRAQQILGQQDTQDLIRDPSPITGEARNGPDSTTSLDQLVRRLVTLDEHHLRNAAP